MKKRGVEAVNILKKAAPFGVYGTSGPFFGLEIGSPIPALLRDFADATFSRFEQMPEGLYIRSLGVASRQTNDGNVSELGRRDSALRLSAATSGDRTRPHNICSRLALVVCPFLHENTSRRWQVIRIGWHAQDYQTL